MGSLQSGCVLSWCNSVGSLITLEVEADASLGDEGCAEGKVGGAGGFYAAVQEVLEREVEADVGVNAVFGVGVEDEEAVKLVDV